MTHEDTLAGIDKTVEWYSRHNDSTPDGPRDDCLVGKIDKIYISHYNYKSYWEADMIFTHRFSRSKKCLVTLNKTLKTYGLDISTLTAIDNFRTDKVVDIKVKPKLNGKDRLAVPKENVIEIINFLKMIKNNYKLSTNNDDNTGGNGASGGNGGTRRTNNNDNNNNNNNNDNTGGSGNNNNYNTGGSGSTSGGGGTRSGGGTRRRNNNAIPQGDGTHMMVDSDDDDSTNNDTDSDIQDIDRGINDMKLDAFSEIIVDYEDDNSEPTTTTTTTEATTPSTTEAPTPTTTQEPTPTPITIEPPTLDDVPLITPTRSQDLRLLFPTPEQPIPSKSGPQIGMYFQWNNTPWIYGGRYMYPNRHQVSSLDGTVLKHLSDMNMADTTDWTTWLSWSDVPEYFHKFFFDITRNPKDSKILNYSADPTQLHYSLTSCFTSNINRQKQMKYDWESSFGRWKNPTGKTAMGPINAAILYAILKEQSLFVAKPKLLPKMVNNVINYVDHNDLLYWHNYDNEEKVEIDDKYIDNYYNKLKQEGAHDWADIRYLPDEQIEWRNAEIGDVIHRYWVDPSKCTRNKITTRYVDRNETLSVGQLVKCIESPFVEQIGVIRDYGTVLEPTDHTAPPILVELVSGVKLQARSDAFVDAKCASRMYSCILLYIYIYIIHCTVC